MSKHFEGSLITKGRGMGAPVTSFTIRGIIADSEGEAEKLIRAEIEKSPWKKEKSLEEGAVLQVRQVDEGP